MYFIEKYIHLFANLVVCTAKWTCLAPYHTEYSEKEYLHNYFLCIRSCYVIIYVLFFAIGNHTLVSQIDDFLLVRCQYWCLMRLTNSQEKLNILYEEQWRNTVHHVALFCAATAPRGSLKQFVLVV